MACPVSQTTLYIDFAGNIFPCYEYQNKNPLGNIDQKNLSDILGSFKGHRDKKECLKCKMNEDVVTGSSLQSTYSTKYNLDHHTNAKLINLDLNLSNQCNFACAMCNSYYSSRWGLSEKKENPIQEVNIENLKTFLNGHLDDLRHVNFAGGEPFLSKNNLNFLHWLSDNAPYWQTEISYNTNLSIVPTDHYELWKKFETVNLNISIDGLKSKGEFIRFGKKWSLFDKNLDQLISQVPTNVILNFHITISSLNIMDWVEVVEYLVKQKNINPQYIDINMVEWPNNLCARYLQPEIKTHVTHILNQDYKRYFMMQDSLLRAPMLINISKAKKYIQLETDHSYDIFTFAKTYKKLRHLNFFETFPKWEEVHTQMLKGPK
jgi:MoaA/NifB/PqqE/SkfB family radical SAM enzyme